MWFTDTACLLQPPPFFGTPTTSHPPPPFLASTPLPTSATYTTGINISQAFSDYALSYNVTYPSIHQIQVLY